MSKICPSNYFWYKRFIQNYPDQTFNRNNAKHEYMDRCGIFKEGMLLEDLIIKVLDDYGNYKDIQEAVADAFWD